MVTDEWSSDPDRTTRRDTAPRCESIQSDAIVVWRCSLPAGHPGQHAAINALAGVEAVWFP